MEGGKVNLDSTTTPGQVDVVANEEDAKQSSSVVGESQAEGIISATEDGVSMMEKFQVQQGEGDQDGKNERGIDLKTQGMESNKKGPDEDTSARENDAEDDQQEEYEVYEDDDEMGMDTLQQTEDAEPPNKIQELVNKAIESKLTGFQEQMEKMMAVLQTVSQGQVHDERAESEADIFELVEEEQEEEEVEHVDEEEMRMAFLRHQEEEHDEAVGDDSKPTEACGSKSDVVEEEKSKDDERASNEETMAKREKLLGDVCSMLEIEPFVVRLESRGKSAQDSKGNEKEYTVLPACGMIKDAWNDKSCTTRSNHINPAIIRNYRWPKDDMEKYGRTMKIDLEANRLVRLVNGRKKGKVLGDDMSKVYGLTKNAESFVRLQQKVISYASYYLAAISKSIGGEKEAKMEDLQNVVTNLEQCLVDLSGLSVHAITMLVRSQRSIYLSSMKLGNTEAQNALLDLPFTSEMLFGDSLPEEMKKYGLKPSKGNADQNEGGFRKAGSKQGGGGGGKNVRGGGGGEVGGGGVGGAKRGRNRRFVRRGGGGNRADGRAAPSPGRMGASPGRGTNRRDDRDRLRGVTISGMDRRNLDEVSQQQGRGGRKRPSTSGRNNSSKRRRSSDSKPTGWQPSGLFGNYVPLSRDLYPVGTGGLEPPSKMDYNRLLEEKARLTATKERGGGYGSSFDTGSRSSVYPPSSFGGGYYRLEEPSAYRGFMNFSDSDGPLMPKGPPGGYGPSKGFSSFSSYANDEDLNQY